MENETPMNDLQNDEEESSRSWENHLLPLSIVFSAVIIAAAWIYTTGEKAREVQAPRASEEVVSLHQEEALILPVVWGDIGKRLVEAGVIDPKKWNDLYEGRDPTGGYKKLLEESPDKLALTKSNAGQLLNALWALGLANKNPILEEGEMVNPAYGGPDRFASTAGWTIARGNPMEHYSRHQFFPLSASQQALVDKISRGIYRPCCDNATHFPDCNHGMAMLGFLELMAYQGVSESEMWTAALTLNSYWFPNEYLTIAAYLKAKGIKWNTLAPQDLLGRTYSSASGYRRVAAEVVPQGNSGSGCGVESGEPQTGGSSGGCGV